MALGDKTLSRLTSTIFRRTRCSRRKPSSIPTATPSFSNRDVRLRHRPLGLRGWLLRPRSPAWVQRRQKQRLMAKRLYSTLFAKECPCPGRRPRVTRDNFWRSLSNLTLNVTTGTARHWRLVTKYPEPGFAPTFNSAVRREQRDVGPSQASRCAETSSTGPTLFQDYCAPKTSPAAALLPTRVRDRTSVLTA